MVMQDDPELESTMDTTSEAVYSGTPSHTVNGAGEGQD